MANLFDNVVAGDFQVDDDRGFFTEAYMPKDIPYMKTMRRIVYFPKGNPNGRGELCFLYSNSIDKTIRLITDTDNFLHCESYYYYYNLHYKGMLYNKRYNERRYDEREEIYDLIRKETNRRIYNQVTISPSENRNLLFDLSYYLELFEAYCKKLQLTKKISVFWEYLKSIIINSNYNGYKHRFVLIDAEQWQLTSSLKENIKNPVYLMYYTLLRYPQYLEDFDIDFIFYYGNRILKVHPSDLTDRGKKHHIVFRNEMKKLYAGTSHLVDEISDEGKLSSAEAELVANESIEKSLKSENSYVDSISSTIEAELDSTDQVSRKISAHVANATKKVMEESTIKNPAEMEKEIEKEAESEIDNDKALLEEIYKTNQRKRVPTSPKSSARDAELKKKQQDIVIKGLTVKELQKKNAKNIEIPVKDVRSSLSTTNPNMGQLKFNNFDETYTKELMPTDITNVILSLNDKSIPMYVRDIKVEDTSDELNYKETYTIYLEDANRQRHTVKVDIPKFIDNRFMYIGGNKKIIKKQNFMYPVVKTGPDTVQIVTNYNKMFIRRTDTKSLGSLTRLEKLVRSNDDFRKLFINGNASYTNSQYVTTLEYDEISKSFVQFKSGKCHFFFSQDEAEQDREKRNIPEKKGFMYIGVDKNGKPVFINTETQKTSDGSFIIEKILENTNESIQTEYRKIKLPKRLMYAHVKVMEQFISVMMLLCFWEGMTKVLKKLNVSYTLVDKLPSELPASKSYIKFADCYMVYDETIPISLLMNGLNVIDTSAYQITDMDQEIPYANYFKSVYGKFAIMNALMNFYEFTIDPITKEVLEDINLPTDLVELMIYAVSLLADSQFIPEIDQSLSRIRSNEIIPAILYEALAKNYINYRNSNGRKKFAIPQDIVIKNILALKTVEDYSTLNPTLEVEASHAVSVKGFRGTNLERAFTVPKRSYHPSMTGIIAPGTSPDGSTGISKTLTLEPSITSLRGYVEIKNDKLGELKDVNLFSPGEMTIPLGAYLDDPTRLGHAIKQSKHVIPVKKSSPVLISNGMEEEIRFKLSSDFCVNAAESGEVIKIDEENKIMIVRYKSGKHQAVKLSGTIVKNAGGGFFLSNILKTDLKEGDKFKNNDVLAYHKDFFTNSRYNNCRMNMGTLTKVAIMSTYNTYQDATMITHKLSEDAATEMCFEKKVVVGKNANVEYMVKVGDTISVGESLITFDTSYEDTDLNALLANLGEEDKESVKANSRNDVPSKYSGVIEEIRLYSTVDLDELSPSLKKIVGDYYKKIKKRNALLTQYDPESANSIMKCGMLCTETTKKVSPNKFGTIKGEKAEDSVVIEFYIKHSEPLEIGSKLA